MRRWCSGERAFCFGDRACSIGVVLGGDESEVLSCAEGVFEAAELIVRAVEAIGLLD